MALVPRIEPKELPEEKIQSLLGKGYARRSKDEKALRDIEDNLIEQISEFQQNPRYAQRAEKCEKTLEEVRKASDECFDENLRLRTKQINQIKLSAKKDTDKTIKKVEEKSQPPPKVYYSINVSKTHKIVFSTSLEYTLTKIISIVGVIIFCMFIYCCVRSFLR